MKGCKTVWISNPLGHEQNRLNVCTDQHFQYRIPRVDDFMYLFIQCIEKVYFANHGYVKRTYFSCPSFLFQAKEMH